LQRTPNIRVQALNSHPPRFDGQFVLYWMTAFRRAQSNFALQRAIEWTHRLKRPLLVLEAIRANYRWSSERFHRFLIDGMIDNFTDFSRSNAMYYPYIETRPGQASGLIETLSKQACLIVSDDFPCFFHPKLYQRIVARWKCAVELVDSNAIVPMRLAERTFTVAHSYRRFMQKELVNHFPDFPMTEPLVDLTVPKLDAVDPMILRRWPALTLEHLSSFSLARLPIDHRVQPTSHKGGPREAIRILNRFVEERLTDYDKSRNRPDEDGASGLSPYLHFGHISPHQIFSKIAESCNWQPEKLAKPNGKMNGFWNLDTNREAFLDQLLTWREIGFNMCCREPNFDRYESLPLWAQTTLADHASDVRQYDYSMEQFENAETHDELWNAAQRQLVREGIIHNYLRMLWGKKILHWTKSPRDALGIMIELNNRFALDGRDPNSYSGIFWTLGRYDRAWGPERPIFGKIRYMTSESTAKKFKIAKYLKRFGKDEKDERNIKDESDIRDEKTRR